MNHARHVVPRAYTLDYYAVDDGVQLHHLTWRALCMWPSVSGRGEWAGAAVVRHTQGRVVQIDPIKTTLKPPGTKKPKGSRSNLSPRTFILGHSILFLHVYSLDTRI